jgi:hypothetical protein
LAEPGGLVPGRSCPPSYGYSPRALATASPLAAEAVYVIGGLYGNALALDAIEALAARETQPPMLIFNGDFHWFDAAPELFASVQHRVLAHTALRGNVETELAADDAAAGCGCAYPEAVPDEDVARSNAILERLRAVARTVPGACAALAGLPMFARVELGAARVGVVHGDAWSLAGWRFAHDALHADLPEPQARRRDDALTAAFELAAVDGYACSHTCAPALKLTPHGFVINNGAAGMANFAGGTHGVITRIALRALPRSLEPARLYGLHETVRGQSLVVDALRVDFDALAYLREFDAVWPAGSPAAVSYRQRIAHGPSYAPDQALGRAPAAAIACA